MRTIIVGALLASAALAQSPRIYSGDGQGKYLGTLSQNRYESDSVSNPYGRYGSKYSTDSINNPYGKYGSEYSPYSARNPYATQAPIIVAPVTPRVNSYPQYPAYRYGWRTR